MILVWLIAAYGMTSIIVWGSIFAPVRNFLCTWSNKGFLKFFWGFLFKLTSCMLCTGTWVGFFLGEFMFTPTGYYFYFLPAEIHWFYDGMFAAGGIWIIHSVVELIEKITNKFN